MSEEELAVLHQMVMVLGAGHVLALVFLAAAIGGGGFLAAIAVISFVAQMSGYSLRDFLKRDET